MVVSTAGYRRSFIEGILTGVMARHNTHVNEVVGRKESGRLVDKTTGGGKSYPGAVACYSPVEMRWHTVT